ncbi:MAG: tol-pal system protein YbgF [Bradyrhizobiaceae bacterium]|nr:tol-pal system protein YbgF [Bradyrhizobiaceae bacterium]
MPTMNIGTVRLLPVAALVLAASIAAGGAWAVPLSATGAIRAGTGAPLVPVQLFGQQQRSDDSELVARLGRLENQIRQLTGMIEELQHRNNQLEQQLKRVQQDTDFRFQEMKPSGRAPAQRSQSDAIPPPPPNLPSVASRQTPTIALPPEPAAAPSGRRGDVFDPATAPDAPGVPRPLGTIPGGSAPGGPGGKPLDLGSLAGSGQPPQALPPASRGGQPPAGSPVGPQAVLAPSDSPKDEYDLAYGAVLRRDYELAVEGFRVFLTNHGKSREPDAQRLMPDAHYWLGESQFQLKQFNDAAETFLKISTDYPNAVRAPEALLRLGQSLAALGERETACASLGHVLTKYPKASESVKRAVEQEQKRVRC